MSRLWHLPACAACHTVDKPIAPSAISEADDNLCYLTGRKTLIPPSVADIPISSRVLLQEVRSLCTVQHLLATSPLLIPQEFWLKTSSRSLAYILSQLLTMALCFIQTDINRINLNQLLQKLLRPSGNVHVPGT